MPSSLQRRTKAEAKLLAKAGFMTVRMRVATVHRTAGKRTDHRANAARQMARARGCEGLGLGVTFSGTEDNGRDCSGHDGRENEVQRFILCEVPEGRFAKLVESELERSLTSVA